MSKKTVARIAVRETLITLTEAKDQFREALLADHQLPAWVNEEAINKANARNLVAQSSLRLTYEPEQQGQETLRLTGLIGISQGTLALGEQLNLAKSEFKDAIKIYRQCFGTGFDMTQLSSQDLREGLLGNLQLQHLHFIQCYRHLKLFPVAPARVGFSWATGTHGSVRLTAHKAIEHLRRNFTDSQALLEDIRLLEQIPETTAVAIKRPLAPHLRANLTWPDSIQQQRKVDTVAKKRFPGQINTPLPLFIQLEAGQPLPEFNAVRPWNPDMKQARLKRRDVRLKPLSPRPDSVVFQYINDQ